MLYERWRQMASEYSGELAILGAQTATFGELARWVENAPAPSEPILFPQGHTLEFVRAVLLAWRTGRVVCPLEPGQAAPVVYDLPKNCTHLKMTSATTGPARMIAFRDEQLFADAANIVSTMGLRPEWPNVGFISLAHSYGFSNLVLPLALFGVPLVLANPPLPEILRTVAKELDAFT